MPNDLEPIPKPMFGGNLTMVAFGHKFLIPFLPR